MSSIFGYALLKILQNFLLQHFDDTVIAFISIIVHLYDVKIITMHV